MSKRSKKFKMGFLIFMVIASVGYAIDTLIKGGDGKEALLPLGIWLFILIAVGIARSGKTKKSGTNVTTPYDKETLPSDNATLVKCEYCESMNSSKAKVCANCGAPIDAVNKKSN